ncbi:sugar ABC transporter ATP-binding protein [Sedimentitalea nanhaiensis]|uniref:Monosaccharide ABC transporter ATP-binding protein, CUT2 family n=1 Tax=Sedimentitalea nanhaiensis TaxID=999627 RepID=A0A1I7BGJ8_9RHOB|nr:sugar ABC transporter ATP-binding protein [Sedimentitalea nanhaiensis]SFT86326.1 monosaccharide ABC transporter ATP-binding protein, CUT2 family [Sedimentitalea nanhaiensis]
MNGAACTMVGIEKAFGPNRVLRGIDMVLWPGQVTVLMGANGAGKSTLVKLLCGVHQPDGGRIELFGRPYAPLTPAEAINAGVVTVHQSINDGVIPDLDVASNLMLDRLTDARSGFFVRGRALRAEAARIAGAMGLDLDVRATVGDLGVAERQLIAIARAMARDPKVLILDEPTSSLSATEAERLFALLDRLRDQGVAILYISHRMSDIRRIADRIISMRDGQISGTFEDAPLDYEGAVTAMLGHGLTQVDITIPVPGPEVLRLDGLCLSSGGQPIDLSLRRGEVVAVTGLLGSGKTALASILFGLMQATAGTVTLNGARFAPQSPGDAIRAGVFLCSKDRASNGVIPDFDITGNLTLPFTRRHARLSFLSGTSERAAARAMIEHLGIICQGPGDGIDTLSGGNQQKVMVGRWLAQTSQVLLLDEPFQGVDIRARRDIGNRIREGAAERATIVFAAELDEALEIADRIVVLNEEALVGEHRNENVDLNRMLAQVSGQEIATGQI